MTSLFIFIQPPSVRSSTVRFDFERPAFIDPGNEVKDHSLIRFEDTFHLFYITGNGTRFGHATSPDLIYWTIHDPVLETGPESCDDNKIWAPTVVRHPTSSHLLMYYTGVNASVAQRTCQAISIDPFSWNKTPSFAFMPFHGDTAWIEWNDNEWSNYRDPAFFAEGDTCYLLHTAETKDGFGCLALASSAEYFTFHDAGSLYIHNSWHMLESCFLLERSGTYHLFFTEENVGGVSHMKSDSLRSGWNIMQRSIIDGGHAPELLDAGDDTYIFSRHTSYESVSGVQVYTIRFDSLSFSGDIPVVTLFETLGADWTVSWGNAFDHQPIFGDNPAWRADHTTVVGFEGNWWIGTAEAYNGPLTGTQPGAQQGDIPRGAIRSRSFRITGRSMRLLVGGGNYPDSCYVALCDAGTDAIIYRETGRNAELMEERIWDLEPHRGREVYLIIVDDCSGPFGHINIDSIEERWVPIDTDGGDGSDIKPDQKIKRMTGDEVEPQPAPAPVIDSYPNPFNPETAIRLSGRPNAPLTVAIYTPSGGVVARFDVRTDASGSGVVHWNGRDGAGRPVAAGVYFAALIDRERVLGVRKLVLLR